MAAVVFNDIGSAWGLKKLFGEETEEAAKVAEERAAALKAAKDFAAAAKAAAVKAAEACAAAVKAAEEAAKVAEEMAVAIHCEQLCTAPVAVFEKESETSKVPYEGVPQVYPCLCYPKELMKKEDEERNAPHYVPMPPTASKVEMRKRFLEWAMKHGKRYYSMYEGRLRYKIWLNTKERLEQLCLKSGRTFSLNEMPKDADLTRIEYKRGDMGIVKPAVHTLSDVKRRILGTMGESWMEKAREGFDQWAERHKRIYSSTEEREKRLLAYMDNMRIIHLWEEHYPGEWGYGNDLENMDQFVWEKELAPAVECSRCRPCNRDSHYY